LRDGIVADFASDGSLVGLELTAPQSFDREAIVAAIASLGSPPLPPDALDLPPLQPDRTDVMKQSDPFEDVAKQLHQISLQALQAHDQHEARRETVHERQNKISRDLALLARTVQTRELTIVGERIDVSDAQESSDGVIWQTVTRAAINIPQGFGVVRYSVGDGEDDGPGNASFIPLSDCRPHEQSALASQTEALVRLLLLRHRPKQAS